MGNWLITGSHYQVSMVVAPSPAEVPLDELVTALLGQVAGATPLAFDLERVTPDTVAGHPARRVPFTSTRLPDSVEGRALLWVDPEARSLLMWQFTPNASSTGQAAVAIEHVDSWTDGAKLLFDCSTRPTPLAAPDWQPPTSGWAVETEANSRTYTAPSRDRSVSLGLVPAGLTTPCEQHVGVVLATVGAVHPGLEVGSPTIRTSLPKAEPGEVSCEAVAPMSLDGEAIRYRVLVVRCPAPSTSAVQVTERDFTEAQDSWLTVLGKVSCPAAPDPGEKPGSSAGQAPSP
jgi:hypothetical protein